MEGFNQERVDLSHLVQDYELAICKFHDEPSNERFVAVTVAKDHLLSHVGKMWMRINDAHTRHQLAILDCVVGEK